MNALLTLQHNGHNSLDRVYERALRQLDKSCEELSKSNNDNPDIKINGITGVYVAREYLKTHIEDMRNILDNYYKAVKDE